MKYRLYTVDDRAAQQSHPTFVNEKQIQFMEEDPANLQRLGGVLRGTLMGHSTAINDEKVCSTTVFE